MSTHTPNYNLEKPIQGEFYNVDVQNKNMDTIDSTLLQIENRLGSAAPQIYEEGFWTPKLDTQNTLYSIQQGTYTRIGNKVFIQARITLTMKGTSTNKLSIIGIPYVGGNETLALLKIIASGLNDPNKKLNCFVGALNKIGIYYESNTSLTAGTYQLIIDDITDQTDFILSGFYSI